MLAAVHVSWPQFVGLVCMFALAVLSIVWRVVVWLRERRHERITGDVIELHPRRRKP